MNEKNKKKYHRKKIKRKTDRQMDFYVEISLKFLNMYIYKEDRDSASKSKWQMEERRDKRKSVVNSKYEKKIPQWNEK